MKNIVSFAVICLLPLWAFCQDKPFVHKSIESFVNQHATMAILPFEVKSEPRKLPKDMTPEKHKELEKERGKTMQQSMFSYYIRKLKNKDIEIQDVDQTNRLLEKAGITIDTIFKYEPNELAKILKVDAVMLNKMLTDGPLTDAAKAVGIGLDKIGLGLGGSNKVTNTTSIYDGATGTLIWRWEVSLKGGIMDADGLVEDLIENYLSKKSPYKKK